jgi:hypothetical protein
MTTIVDFSTDTYGELQVDSPDRMLHQDIQAPIFNVATEKKYSNEDQGRQHCMQLSATSPRTIFTLM